MLDSNLYERYINELRVHLFDDQPIEKIVSGIHNHHRKRRFMAMYVLQSRDTFHTFYERRRELGMEKLFNQILGCLFHEREKSLLKQELIRMLEITPEMITSGVSSFEIREMAKDLNSFAMYQTKRETLVTIL